MIAFLKRLFEKQKPPLTEEQKREEWERIKKDDPVLAEVMKLHVQAFGKPTEFVVRFNDEKVREVH
jgi:hypothetical protein